MSLKTKLLVMGAILGIVASQKKKTDQPAIVVEGTDTKPMLKDKFSGHRYKKVYPPLNEKNRIRKEKHQKKVQDLAEMGICWTPEGLYSMHRP